MILTDSEVASLKAAISWWEWFGYASTAVVGVGCIGEFIAEFTAVSKHEGRKHKLSRLSLIILIFGIAGELLSAVHSSNLSGELIASIEERARKAEQKAAEANDRATTNEKEAAQLRKDAEGERLARVKIEAGVAWRTLTHEQQKELISALSRFARQIGVCSFLANDMEAFSFSAEIATTLRAAKWQVVPPNPNVMDVKLTSLPTTASPIQHADFGIEVASTPDRAAVVAAHAVVEEFRRLGFDAHFNPASQQPEPSCVWITVDHRPLGSQGAARQRGQAGKN